MTHTPSFASAPPAPHAPHRFERYAVITLGVLLAAQCVFLQRDRIAANPHLRPLAAGLCHSLGCELPPWHEPSAITMLARDVIAVPDHPGVLRVQASFRNDARWSQPWPALMLTLSDINGHTLGKRRFLPSEYHSGATASNELAPGQAGQIAFDIAEPAPSVVAFDFQFE